MKKHRLTHQGSLTSKRIKELWVKQTTIDTRQPNKKWAGKRMYWKDSVHYMHISFIFGKYFFKSKFENPDVNPIRYTTIEKYELLLDENPPIRSTQKFIRLREREWSDATYHIIHASTRNNLLSHHLSCVVIFANRWWNTQQKNVNAISLSHALPLIQPTPFCSHSRSHISFALAIS